MGNNVALEMVRIRAALRRLERTDGGRFQRQTVSLREAAMALQVSPKQLAAMITVGAIRVTRFERRRVVPISEVERLRP